MFAITNYGIYLLVIATALLWWKPDHRQDARNTCLLAGVSFLASLAFNQLLLLFIRRIRPYDPGVSHLLIAPNPDWSFPYDHATGAAVADETASTRNRHRLTSGLNVVSPVDYNGNTTGNSNGYFTTFTDEAVIFPFLVSKTMATFWPGLNVSASKPSPSV